MQYDANGIRYSKVVPSNGSTTTTTYFYDGNKLAQEKTVWTNGSQTSTTTRTYLYNSQGLVGFAINNTLYSYRKNLFGDIIAIYQGATKVAEYKYDAYGNCTVIDPTTGLPNASAAFIGNQNPFRYRGYYWDNDLQLYYLMSRYYDPATGRFINADSLEYLDPETIGGLNLYAYCGNNPVMNVDPTGHFVVGVLIGVAFGFIGAVLSDWIDDGYVFNGSKDFWDYAGAVIGGAIGGAAGAISNTLGSIAVSIAGDILGELIAGNISTWEQFGIQVLTSLCTSILSESISSFVGEIVATHQYKQIRGVSRDNIKVNKYIKGLQGSYKHAGVTNLKIGRDSMDTFVALLQNTNKNIFISDTISNTTLMLISIWSLDK